MKCTDNNLSKLEDEGKIVEVEEPKFGKRNYNHVRVIEEYLLFGGIEREFPKNS